jgi:FixJ family two-component response regulator
MGIPRGLPVEEIVMASPKLVAVVDDDTSVRESLPDLLQSFGLHVEVFASGEAFLTSGSLERTGCLVLDVAMPGMSGPELQRELAQRKQSTPIVFITAHADERIAAALLDQGAVAYLSKPFSESAILEAVNRALRET